MRFISKILLIISLSILNLSAIEINGETVGDTIDKFVSDVQPIYKKGDYTMECPVMRPGYIARVSRYDYSAGRTYCNVYEIDKNTNIASATAKSTVIYNENYYAKDYFTNINDADRSAIDTNLNLKWSNLGKDIVNSQTHKDLQDKYFKNYVNVGGDEFLTASKYLLAGITMDGEIIDLKRSILTNDIALNPGYTIYANSSTALQNSPLEWWQKMWNDIKSAIGLAEKEMTDSDKDKAWENQKLFSESKQMLNNLMVFIMDFFAEMNETYNDVTFWMLLVVLPFTIFFGMQRMITKRLHEHQHQDDVAERLFLGIIIFFFFYIGQTTYEIDKDKNIDQSQFQNSSRFLLYKGVDWADELTRAMAKSYVAFKIKDAGIIGKDNTKELSYQINLDTKKRTETLNVLENQCFEYYDIKAISADYHIGKEQHFTPDTSIFDHKYLKPAYSGLKDDTSNGIKNVPTINACYHLKRELQMLNMSIKGAKDKISNFHAALGAGGIEKRMNLVAESIYKNTADNGFLAAPLIGTSNIFLDGVEAFSTRISRENKDKNNKETDNPKRGNFKIMTEITDNAAYMMLSGASSLRETIYQMLKSEKGGIISASASLMITIVIMITMVKYAPILAMTSASILVIVFYYISVEVFYLTAPFVVVYAFASNQQQHIITLLSKFLALSIKPLMIVLSIILAMLAIKLFEGINNSIIGVNFDMFQQVLDLDKSIGIIDNWSVLWERGMDFVKDTLNVVGITFIGSIAKLMIQVFSTLAVFYIVFNGADMFIKMLGFKEAGIDVQESLGREIDNGSGRYSRPI